MFVSIVVVLLVLAALVAEGSSAVGDNAVVLICLLLMAGFFGVIASAQRDRQKNDQRKFGDDLPKARKRSRRKAGQSRYRWAVGCVVMIALVGCVAVLAFPERSRTPVAAPSTTALAVSSPALPKPTPNEQPTEKSSVAEPDSSVWPANTVTPAQPAGTCREAPCQQVTAAVKQWAKAWSSGDVEQYLSMYSPSFAPPQGITREQWEASRRLRISAAKQITVTVDPIGVELQSPGHARAIFIQHYQTAALKELTRKTLHLVEVNGRWTIESELAVPVATGKNG